MCGIVGILRCDGTRPHPGILRAMNDAVSHRGPDGQGLHIRDGVGLGHRRLSIIDLEGGVQPMSNENGDVWTTYNGEIYNFAELRETLLGSGHIFRTSCDTEVIVHAYEQWGPNCVERFRGMFAFAVADYRQRRLMLARDQLGIKPLCYRRGPGYVAFASELNALLPCEARFPSLRPESLEYYLRYRYIPAPDTIYQDVFKLPPATCMVFDFSGRVIEQREYWKLEFAPDERPTDEQWLEEFQHVLRESVRAHLVADVPFGAFLSGGVDSTLVVMEMSRLLERPVKAFSIGFEEEKYSELKFAREAADELGVELRSEVVRPDIGAVLDELFQHYGEPFADTSAVPTWCVSRLARTEVPMVLSGDGGDEAFGGYQRYETWMQTTFWGDLSKLLSHPRRAFKRILATLLGRTGDSLASWQESCIVAMRTRTRRNLWRPELRWLATHPCPAFVRAGQDATRSDRLARVQHLDIKTYLPGDILTKVDVASMCHGLEARTPLTDIRVMEFAARLPMRMRREAAAAAARRLKVLPKQALSRRFGNEFAYRSKQGFGIPETEWMRRGSPLRERFQDLVASPQFPLFDYFEADRVHSLLNQFDRNGRHAVNLWLLFGLGMWMERRQSRSLVKIAA